MPNPLRRPRPPMPPPSSLALLATLPPRLSEHVTLSLHASRRLLEVRADYVLLFRRGAVPHPSLDVSQLQALLPLTDLASAMTGKPDIVVRIGGQKVAFRDESAAQRLHAMVKAAVAASNKRASYDLGAELGRGATSVVCAATRTDARAGDPHVAVKLLPKAQLLSESGALRNLLAERAALLALARSPHAVHLLDVFQTRTHVALVTELAPRGDLQHALARLPARRFSVAAARALAAELVLAVGDAHRAGRVVRDVKLANALLTAGGRVRLADFGLAKALRLAGDSPRAKGGARGVLAPDSLSTSSVTDSEDALTTDDEGYLTHDDDAGEPRFVQRAHSFVGTRRYMAPEVAARRAGYAAGADVWALGVALHVLLTGRYPFHGDDVGERGVVGAAETAALGGLRAIDADAAHLVERMLCRDPLERADLSEVRRHRFFKDVRWGALRDAVRRDAPSRFVLSELRAAGIAHALGPDGGTAREAVPVDGAGMVGRWELLGLEYLGEGSH